MSLLYKFLRLFSGIVVSGEEKTRKPFDKIYQLTIDRYNLNCDETVFIDDNRRNINAAINFGIKKSILFKKTLIFRAINSILI